MKGRGQKCASGVEGGNNPQTLEERWTIHLFEPSLALVRPVKKTRPQRRSNLLMLSLPGCPLVRAWRYCEAVAITAGGSALHSSLVATWLSQSARVLTTFDTVTGREEEWPYAIGPEGAPPTWISAPRSGTRMVTYGTGVRNADSSSVPALKLV
jgi:hypothetical protein